MIRAALRRIAPPAVWIVLAFTVYAPALPNVPRRDDQLYLAERAFHPRAWDWFVHSLSYTRTRVVAPGDAYLCRPGHYVVLCLSDLLWRSDPLATGAVSIVLVGLAAWSLQRLTNRFVPWWLASGLAVNFLVQYAGLEMVLWRHISPYLAALSLFAWGVILLPILGRTAKETGDACQVSGALRRWLPSLTLLFFASLFHEMVPAGLLLTSALLALGRPWRMLPASARTALQTKRVVDERTAGSWRTLSASLPTLAASATETLGATGGSSANANNSLSSIIQIGTAPIGEKEGSPGCSAAKSGMSSARPIRVAAMLLLPTMGYFLWNAVDYFTHAAPALVGPGDKLPMQWSLTRTWDALWTFLKASATAFFAPGMVQLEPGSAGLLSWEFVHHPRLQQILGAIVLGLVGLIVIDACSAMGQRRFTARHLAGLLSVGLLGALAAAIGIGRILLRGPGYLFDATYYYSLTAFALSALLAAALAILRDPHHATNRLNRALPGSFTWLTALAGALIWTLAVINGCQTRAYLVAHADRWKSFASEHRCLAEVLRRDHLRVAGILPGSEAEVHARVSLLLLHEFRQPRAETRDVLLTVDSKGHVVPRECPIASADALPAVIAAVDEVCGTAKFAPVVDIGLVAEVSGLQEGVKVPRLWLRVKRAVRPEAADIRFAVDVHEVYVERYRGGSWQPRENIAPLPRAVDPAELTLVSLDGHICLFAGQDLLTSAPNE